MEGVMGQLYQAFRYQNRDASGASIVIDIIYNNRKSFDFFRYCEGVIVSKFEIAEKSQEFNIGIIMIPISRNISWHQFSPYLRYLALLKVFYISSSRVDSIPIVISASLISRSEATCLA